MENKKAIELLEKFYKKQGDLINAEFIIESITTSTVDFLKAIYRNQINKNVYHLKNFILIWSDSQSAFAIYKMDESQ